MSEIAPRAFSFPVKIAEIQESLPHRGSAIWVDEVLSAQLNEGECKILFNRAANYSDEKFIRESSYIEWMAQSFGYVSAIQVLSGMVGGKQKAQKAYLVGIRNFTPPARPLAPIEGDWLRCWVKKTNELGPIILVEGKIYSSAGDLVASAQLKVFSQ